MRKFKFRAWHKASQKMVVDFDQESATKVGILVGDSIHFNVWQLGIGNKTLCST